MNLRKDHYRLTNYYSVVTSNPCQVPPSGGYQQTCTLPVNLGRAILGEPATLCFLKREGGVTSSRVRRRRFNDTGTTPPVSRWRACSEARREDYFTPALPDNFLTLLVYRL